MFALLVIPLAAQAQIQISTFILDFQSGKQARADFQVRNPTDEIQYVSITPFRILAPGTKSLSREPLREPRKFGLLVSPAKMVLPPKTTKTARVVMLRPADKSERIYRITVKPIFGRIQSSTNAVKVAIGYDMLVIVRSETPTAKIDASRKGRKLTLHNAGNTSVYLTAGQQCSAGNTDCVRVPGRRLYEGNTWTVTLPKEGPVKYLQVIGNSSQTVKY